jgi:hypothetical protein
MPGFLGGSSSGSGTGGEIAFPKEFIDPVTKLRVSQPENLIDTDFEYGVQPTKWETVELINNTPSFFSKSGDTTIPNITSITTNTGTREITVVTALEHGLSAGIPINVTGTKSVTADGAYIINSIPNLFTFTYLCKDNQNGNNSIEDLYTSIITGEFFQGSQLRIADAEGITTNAASPSVLTVKTDSTHGFGLATPFYFLNLNSSISQEFEAANTAAKSFDSSNSATAQTFDGSNTLSTFNIDWSNSATVAGVVSTITSVNTTTDVISVSHTTENFSGLPVGAPLYYNVTASTGYFNTNPRGVVFLKSLLTASTSVATFTVSAVPDGDVIDLQSAMTGTFQRANQARTFAGNNIGPTSQVSLELVSDTPQVIDAANSLGGPATVSSYSGSLITLVSDSGLPDLGWYPNAMLQYSTTGSAASGLSNGTSYWIDTLNQAGSNTLITIKSSPTGSPLSSISGGSGVQKFKKIGVDLASDTFNINSHGYIVGDMVKYTFPAAGNFAADSQLNYYYVESVINTHNFKLGTEKGGLTIMDGSTAARAAISGQALKNTSNTYGLGLTTGIYWIKSAAMPNPLQMVVDMTRDNGGYDFYFITGGPSHNFRYQTQGGAALGLVFPSPRSPDWWRAASNAVLNYRPSGSYQDYFQTVYNVWSNSPGNYTNIIMRWAPFYGSGTTAWQTDGGGRWWLRNSTFGEPNGDYGPQGWLGGYSFPNPYNGEDLGFNDITPNYPTGNYYLVSTNAKA